MELLIFVVLAFGYLAPTLIALERKHSAMAGISILNVALGWTLLGWVGALVWAVTGGKRRSTTSSFDTSGDVSPPKRGGFQPIHLFLGGPAAVVAVAVALMGRAALLAEADPKQRDYSATANNVTPDRKAKAAERAGNLKAVDDEIAAKIRKSIEEGNARSAALILPGISDKERAFALKAEVLDALVSEVRKVPAADAKKNADFYRVISKLDPADGRASEKLAHYEGLSDLGRWKIWSGTSQLSGQPAAHARLAAKTGRARNGKVPELYIRCQDNTTDFYVNFHEYLGWDDLDGSRTKNVFLRYDDGGVLQQTWSLSTNFDAAFARSAISKARKLTSVSQLVVQTTPYGENPLTATFDVRGAYAALKDVASTCNWTLNAPGG